MARRSASLIEGLGVAAGAARISSARLAGGRRLRPVVEVEPAGARRRADEQADEAADQSPVHVRRSFRHRAAAPGAVRPPASGPGGVAGATARARLGSIRLDRARQGARPGSSRGPTGPPRRPGRRTGHASGIASIDRRAGLGPGGPGGRGIGGEYSSRRRAEPPETARCPVDPARRANARAGAANGPRATTIRQTIQASKADIAAILGGR